MLRLAWGVLLGLIIGGGIAALLVKGLGVVALGALVAYPLAVLVGVLTGLVAGKPIWAKGARIEAGLKAAFGALLASGAMYALRTWVGFDLDLTSLQLGQGAAGQLTVVALPAIAVVLSLLFEADNLFGKSDGDSSEQKQQLQEKRGKVRVGKGQAEEVEVDEEVHNAARRKR